MASLTIRNLDDATKQALRERAARHGRSMEEEVRHLLRNAAAPDDTQADAQAGAAVSAPLESDRPTGTLAGRRILLVITGGIAAYKCLDLIRRLRERGATVRPVMTAAARQFITPLAVGALAAEPVFEELFSREDEQDVGHIRLAREADLLLVAPATADFIGKMALGLADDLASTILLATRAPVLIAPAMNPAMWSHPAVQRNVELLRRADITMIGPMPGEMAESGEAGLGRMAEPLEIATTVETLLDDRPKPLAGRTALVTSGPTHEPIDPVRYVANRSSGKQGHAIARALANSGADVTLISGPVTIGDPANVRTVHVESARDMLAAVEARLPVDIAVMVAAVADWRVADQSDQKIKKQPGSEPPPLRLTENPDILRTVGHHASRPGLVVGFAAETQNLETNARAKLERKGADWIVANDVSPHTGIMGGDRNRVRIVGRDGIEDWPDLDKEAVAERLAERITHHIAGTS